MKPIITLSIIASLFAWLGISCDKDDLGSIVAFTLAAMCVAMALVYAGSVKKI